VGPVPYDCVKVITVREGSAILFGEFGQKPVTVGDVTLLGTSVLCGSEPEGSITATTVYLDTDYAVDLFFWQHAGLLYDRLDAHDVAAAVYADPVQFLRLGEARAGGALTVAG
jgi:AraC family transcriptional regulator